MKKTIKAVPVLAMIVLSLLISPLKVNAAETTKEYTVTYRPGNIAKFSDALLQKYEDRYGEDKVSISQATGSISITVPAGSYYPEAPQAADIVLDEAHQGRYYVTTGWIPTEEIVMQDDDYVVDFGALVDAVNYTIRYVDAASGMDLAAPTMSQGNAGDVITATAKVIENYAWNVYLSQMTLDKEQENVITFQYTYVKSPEYEIIYLEGETVYNVITIPGRVVPGATAEGTDDDGNQGQDTGNEGGQETGNEGTREEGGQGTGNEGIGEQGGQNDQDNQGNQGSQDANEEVIMDEVIIDEEDVPLAEFLDENGTKVGLLIAGITGLGLLLAFTAYRMKKDSESEEQ